MFSFFVADVVGVVAVANVVVALVVAFHENNLGNLILFIPEVYRMKCSNRETFNGTFSSLNSSLPFSKYQKKDKVFSR